MVFRATAARETGPLNESFYHRDGETEFTIRMRSLGWELECVPAAVVHTDFGQNSIYLNTRNHLEIIRRHAPKRFLARELARVCYLVARDVVSLRRRPTPDTWNRLRGMIDFARRQLGPAPGTSGARPRNAMNRLGANSARSHVRCGGPSTFSSTAPRPARA